MPLTIIGLHGGGGVFFTLATYFKSSVTIGCIKINYRDPVLITFFHGLFEKIGHHS